MNALTEKELFQYFKKQIQTEGEKEIAREKLKFDQLMVEKKQAILVSLNAKYELKSQLMRAELKHQFDQSVRALEIMYQTNDGKERMHNISLIFEKVIAKIHHFTTTESYVKTMESWLTTIPNLQSDRLCDCYYRQADLAMVQLLKRFLPKTNFFVDASIQLGGFFLKFDQEKTRYDFTLDSQWKGIQIKFFEKDIRHE
jgi:hypothetical protein